MRAARKVPHSTDAAVSGSTDEPPAAPRPRSLALRLFRCRNLRVILSMGRDQPLPRQRVADNVRAATEPSGTSEGESAEM